MVLRVGRGRGAGGPPRTLPARCDPDDPDFSQELQPGSWNWAREGRGHWGDFGVFPKCHSATPAALGPPKPGPVGAEVPLPTTLNAHH